MKKYIVTIVLVVVVGAGAFYGGMLYGKPQAGTRGIGSFQRGANGGMPGTGIGGAFGGANGGLIAGQIISKDSQNITVALRNGSSTKIVFFSGSTQIMKSASGTVDDLKDGEEITVIGTTNPDGSITAQSIQIGGRFGANQQR
jgi:hypothetical protein